MIVVIVGAICLIFLSIGLIYPISHIINILNDPIITFSLYDELVWFTACIIIVLMILDILFIKCEIDYIYAMK